MGQVKGNLLTKGFSGKIGDEIVFRQVGKTTRFGKRPGKRTTLTPNQAIQTGKFQQAVYYARTALMNETTRADYALAAKDFKLRSAYVAAVTDYLKEPSVAVINTVSYKGIVGETLEVIAEDEFKIVEAVFTIKRADDTVLETGAAVRAKTGWQYTTKVVNAAIAGTKVMVTLKDRLNKTGAKEVVMV